MNNASADRGQLLQAIIEKAITANPFSRDGFSWAALSVEAICSHLGCSPKTLQRLLAKPPFVWERAQVDGRMTTILRVGTPGPKTHRHVANTMSAIWRQRFDRTVSRREYGCLIGLAGVWPEGHQIEIFKLVTSADGLREYMAGAHIQIELLGDAGFKRYFKHPVISLLRLFPEVAVELYAMRKQEKGSKAWPDLGKPASLGLKPLPPGHGLFGQKKLTATEA